MQSSSSTTTPTKRELALRRQRNTTTTHNYSAPWRSTGSTISHSTPYTNTYSTAILLYMCICRKLGVQQQHQPHRVASYYPKYNRVDVYNILDTKWPLPRVMCDASRRLYACVCPSPPPHVVFSQCVRCEDVQIKYTCGGRVCVCFPSAFASVTKISHTHTFTHSNHAASV